MESRSRQPELVVYDVDGTMIEDIPGQTTGVAFWRLYDMGLLDPSDETLSELETLNQLMTEGDETNEWLNAEYSKLITRSFDTSIGGLKKRDITRVFEEHADYIASEQIYPEMLDEVDYWKDRDAAQVLISGSPDPFVQALRRRLDLKWGTGTRLFYRQGKIDEARLPSPRASEKHLIAEKMRQRLSSELGSEAVFASGYGDTMNDYTMLDASREPVAVNPKSDLREIAANQNWRILDTVNTEIRIAS